MTYYKNILPLNVTNLNTIYDMNEDTDGVSSQYLYRVAEAHPPGNINTTFTIVDEHGRARARVCPPRGITIITLT